MGKPYRILVLTFLPLMLICQQAKSLDTLTRAYVEVSALASSSGYVPLWMRSLQYGAVPYEGNGGIVKGYYGKIYEHPTKRYQKLKTYDYQYEVEAVGFAGKENDIRLIQAYVAGRARKWELAVGRRKEIIGLGDSTLTSGFWSMSGNAMPHFKYSFGTTDYLDFAGGFFGIRMRYSDGLQDNFGPTQYAYIHQKSLYGRIGKRASMFNFFAGMNHNVSWGGERKVKTGSEFDVYPSGWGTYFYVVTALKDRSIVEVDPNTSSDDAGNQYGNHLGSIDVALQAKVGIHTFLAYKQTAYETGRIASLTTANDGIVGLSWKYSKNESILNHLVIEYIYTANQGNYNSGLAKLLNLDDPHKTEVETYYNNGGRGPWHYYGKGLGTPLIPIDRESTNKSDFYFSQNAVKAIYMGASGNFLGYEWMMRASQSFHAAPRSFFFPRLMISDMISQTSWSLGVSKKITNVFQWQVQIGGDHGDKLEKSIGGMLTVKRLF